MAASNSSYLTAPDFTASIQSPSDSYTVDIWLQTTDTTHSMSAFAWGPNNEAPYIGCNSGVVLFQVADTGSFPVLYGGSINDGNPHHFRVRLSGGMEARIFVDGVLQVTQAASCRNRMARAGPGRAPARPRSKARQNSGLRSHDEVNILKRYPSVSVFSPCKNMEARALPMACFRERAANRNSPLSLFFAPAAKPLRPAGRSRKPMRAALHEIIGPPH